MDLSDDMRPELERRLALGVVEQPYDPLAMVGTPLFTRLSATLPAVAVAFAVHVVLTRLIVIPAGKGDYPAP